MKAMIMFAAVLWGMLVIALQLVAMNKDKIIALDIIKDPFAVGNLQANVYWNGYEYLIGVFFIAAIAIILIAQKINFKTQITSILICTLCFTFATTYFITPRIEGYSQNAAIEFYKEKQKEDCYIETLGFKSYAHLFYFNKQKPANPNSLKEEWLLNGKIDKPVYFVIKNLDVKDYLVKYPELKVVDERNGFAFAKREIQ